MYNFSKVPEWAVKGPEDFEYRTYKMLSHANSIREELKIGKLWHALNQCDEVLEFLYQYDAERHLEKEATSTKLNDIDWNNIERAYFLGDNPAEDPLLEDLVDQAIDIYEVLHSEIRHAWRNLESSMSVSYISSRPYLLNSGFVFVILPNNKLYIYSFENPKVNGVEFWREFKLTQISETEYKVDDLVNHVDEIKQKDPNKIIYRITLKKETKINDGVINIISSNIFIQLRKDYGF